MVRIIDNSEMDPSYFLGPNGPVARKLANYETRPEQLEMAEAIRCALDQSHHLIAEAGTGVGKSFAYLIPAINWAVNERKKIAISTHTISLQEQLYKKDIPFIQEISEQKFTATLAKGRANYLCWRRLEQARRRGPTLFDDDEEIQALEELHHWSMSTMDGSLSDLPTPPPRGIWESVCSENETCVGRQCKKFNNCFYQQARRKMFGSDLIILNHALLFSDLSLRLQGGKVLPDFQSVILDEAHNIENVASKHFGLRLSNFQIRFLLNRLFNTKTQRGILAPFRDIFSLKDLDTVEQASTRFFAEVSNAHERMIASGGNGRLLQPDALINTLSGPLHNLGMHLRQNCERLASDDDALEVNAYAQRCLDYATMIHLFITQDVPDHVYWLEATPPRPQRKYNRSVICAAPLHIGHTLNRVLFEPFNSVIMTSATISTAGKKITDEDTNTTRGFEFFTSRLSMNNYQALQLGSPFNYEEQVKLYVHADMPEARENEEEFLKLATKAIRKYLLQTEGKAFILFTSFKQLNQMAKNLSDFCFRNNYMLLTQGKDMDRTTLLNTFRENTNSVLLGTDSFWQGVDVPGESLSNVIIFKLPFSVPDNPLLQARLDQIRSQGGSPFFEYQLPEAILKFKQGFGRLIRTRNDKGIVVVLDPRVVSKNYGRAFLNALPSCSVEIVRKTDTTIIDEFDV